MTEEVIVFSRIAAFTRGDRFATVVSRKWWELAGGVISG